MKLLFTADWLRRKIASDPDNEECEAGSWRDPQMSWSFSVIGKPQAVAKAAVAAMETNKCAQPEEAYRLDCLGNITSMANQLLGPQLVRVSASGSMYKVGDEVKSHTMSLTFEPVHGYIE